jgi:hypothetical protein
MTFLFQTQRREGAEVAEGNIVWRAELLRGSPTLSQTNPLCVLRTSAPLR